MVQLIYSICAIMLLGSAFLNVNLKVHGAEERMMFSELALGVTSVGTELLNEIGKAEFDPGTISGLLVVTDSLRFADTFGGGSCDPDLDYLSCFTINDFHGKTATRRLLRVHAGATHEVVYDVTDITVEYVSETPPHVPPASPPSGYRTFAKRVTLTISSPTLLGSDNQPLAFGMSRVYMYPNF
jgi:hypothetical protein